MSWGYPDGCTQADHDEYYEDAKPERPEVDPECEICQYVSFDLNIWRICPECVAKKEED